jgi:hypothetical protein
MDHLVVDSLMKCGIGVDDLTGQKDFVDALSTIARDTGLHIHLVCHMRKGENEKTPPDKFSVKGAGEIADMPDNIVIVWKNLRKPEQKPNEPASDEPDSYVRIAGQRHHPWEGSFAFWFHKDSQQFLEPRCAPAAARHPNACWDNGCQEAAKDAVRHVVASAVAGADAEPPAPMQRRSRPCSKAASRSPRSKRCWKKRKRSSSPRPSSTARRVTSC